jgi:hypothetical protein
MALAWAEREREVSSVCATTGIMPRSWGEFSTIIVLACDGSGCILRWWWRDAREGDYPPNRDNVTVPDRV